LTGRCSRSWRKLQVIRHVVDKTPVDSDGSPRTGHVANLLWCVSDKASTIVPAHDGHALKVPVWPWVGCENPEIMVLRVDIGIVVEVEDDIWADTSADTVTKCTDLHGGQNEDPRISSKKDISPERENIICYSATILQNRLLRDDTIRRCVCETWVRSNTSATWRGVRTRLRTASSLICGIILPGDDIGGPKNFEGRKRRCGEI
jgi:hypothetical protein